MSFQYALETSTPQQFEGGTKRTVTVKNIPRLRDLALYSLSVEPGCLRELHWHPNAGELSYCLAGQGRMGVFSPAGDHDILDVRAGSITFFPRNYFHYIQNTGSTPLRLIVGFSSEDPEHIDVSESFNYFPGSVLAGPFGAPADIFDQLPRRGDTFLVKDPTAGALDFEPAHPAASYTAHTDDLPKVDFEGGTVKKVTTAQLARLELFTVFWLRAEGYGLREPHWHPNAGELNYCIDGEARVGIFGPGGVQETVHVGPGDVAYIPAGWFHYIENVGTRPIEFLVFFSNVAPNHIDLSETFDFFPRGVYAASFGKPSTVFDALPKKGDVFIAAGRQP